VNQQFQPGDKVIVHASPFVAHASKQVDRSASPRATIVREMPYSEDERGHREYEVHYDDGQMAGRDVIVYEDRLTPAE
jgi:hypothetical protein